MIPFLTINIIHGNETLQMNWYYIVIVSRKKKWDFHEKKHRGSLNTGEYSMKPISKSIWGMEKVVVLPFHYYIKIAQSVRIEN